MTFLLPTSHINDASGRPCTTEDSTLQRWTEYYNKALNHPPAPECQELSDLADSAMLNQDISDDAPTLSEVRTAILKLRNGRADGCDGIPPELLKCAVDPVSTTLHLLFTKVQRSGRVPADWRDGIIVSLYKGKGPKSDCSSFRPTTLLSVPGNVFAHALLARLQPLL